MYQNELYHHGILGMKWGVRRFQNKGGGLTAAGKARYSNKSFAGGDSHNARDMSDDELRKYITRRNLEKQYNKLKDADREPSKLELTKKAVDDASNSINRIRNNMSQTSYQKTKPAKKLDLSNMTDKELRDKLNRADLERRYNEVFNTQPEKINKGREYVTKTLEVGGKVFGVASSALAVALAIQQLKNG